MDPRRPGARRGGPFKTTVAHGFLTLSLLPEMAANAYDVADRRMGVNYGLNKVRFPSPVPVGSRLRGHFKLLEYKPIEGGAQLTIELSVEREGSTNRSAWPSPYRATSSDGAGLGANIVR